MLSNFAGGTALELTKIEPELDEVMRYWGWKRKDSDPEIYEIYKRQAEAELVGLKKIIKPKAVYLEITSELMPVLEAEVFSGKAIKAFIWRQTPLYLMAVTLGFEYEKLLVSAAHESISRLALLEACGTALVECGADVLSTYLMTKAGAQVFSRFSPGYGDWPLKYQGDILDLLKAEKIGLYLNKQMLMMPRKSITAVLKMAAFNSSCEDCQIQPCDQKNCHHTNR